MHAFFFIKENNNFIIQEKNLNPYDFSSKLHMELHWAQVSYLWQSYYQCLVFRIH
jgi:hypothetical protein